MKKGAELVSWIGNRFGKPPGWERIARFFAPPGSFAKAGDVLVIRDGMLYLIQPWVNVGWHIAMFGEYEPEVRRAIRAVLTPGCVAVDIGANIGWHTVLLARRVGREGMVIAAEANPWVREKLERNIALNRLENVRVIPDAIGDGEGQAEFYGPPAADESSGRGRVLSDPSIVDHSVITVRIRGLDQVMRDAKAARCDFIKIDVEGYEWPVLQGAIETIGTHRPHVLFEFDAAYAARGGGSAAHFEEFFRTHHYSLYRLEPGHAYPIKPGHWPERADVWAIPDSI